MDAMTRRRFLGASMALASSFTVAGRLFPDVLHGKAQEPFIGSVRLENRAYAISAVDPGGRQLWQVPVDARCHGGCFRPDSNDVVLFERRPGWSFYVLNRHTGRQSHRIKAGEGEHFYGHGVFCPEGRLLYATISRYHSGEGFIAIFDSAQDYRRVKTLALNGIGPHEVKLHPDGQTLVVGLGGIRTHPDYERIKLNLDTMRPALVLISRSTGEILARLAPSDHQLSCRHLDTSPEGHIYAGYQYQGAAHDLPPLVCRYRDGNFDEISFPQGLQNQLNNYVASLAVHPESDTVAITAPRGGLTLVFDGATGQVLNQLAIADCAGVAAMPGGYFLVSTGRGELHRISATKPASQLARLPLQWDNHLI